MARYTVWSKFDGQPLPARNKRERDDLLKQGNHAEPPVIAEHGPELVVPEEAAHVVQSAGADSGDLPADDKPRRVRGRKEPVAERVADDTGGDDQVPAAAEQRD